MHLLLLVIAVVCMLSNVLSVEYQTRRQLTVYVGDSIVLPCHTTSAVSVYWRETKTQNIIYGDFVIFDKYRQKFNSDLVEPALGNYNLTLRDAQLNDSGLYVCIEDNGAGNEHLVSLTVSAPLTPSGSSTLQPPAAEGNFYGIVAQPESKSSSIGMIAAIAGVAAVIVFVVIVIVVVVRRRMSRCQPPSDGETGKSSDLNTTQMRLLDNQQTETVNETKTHPDVVPFGQDAPGDSLTVYYDPPQQPPKDHAVNALEHYRRDGSTDAQGASLYYEAPQDSIKDAGNSLASYKDARDSSIETPGDSLKYEDARQSTDRLNPVDVHVDEEDLKFQFDLPSSSSEALNDLGAPSSDSRSAFLAQPYSLDSGEPKAFDSQQFYSLAGDYQSLVNKDEADQMKPAATAVPPEVKYYHWGPETAVANQDSLPYYDASGSQTQLSSAGASSKKK